MDLGRLNEQLNAALNRWIAAIGAYFSALSRNEQYGWALFSFGLLLFVAGIFLL